MQLLLDSLYPLRECRLSRVLSATILRNVPGIGEPILPGLMLQNTSMEENDGVNTYEKIQGGS